MRFIGILAILAGIILIALKLAAFAHPALAVIDTWGAMIGWVIRGSLIVAGLVLVVIGRPKRRRKDISDEETIML
ncbi:MAG: hypothetical protein OEZ10_05710 [Gammaproteobacteria bacterium]|nr:hypothetical protein [Gammaproteobacteria bacterium]